jgi:hypothetical protein
MLAFRQRLHHRVKVDRLLTAVTRLKTLQKELSDLSLVATAISASFMVVGATASDFPLSPFAIASG